MSNKTWRRWLEGVAALMIVCGAILASAGSVPEATFAMSTACANFLATMTIFKDEDLKP